ncbi:MAG: hypothetical protein PHV11_08955 [Candidatus Bipolaricaulis sp.]|nr:hypothetical protein [Candidatus Bipolaricaulis sp.]
MAYTFVTEASAFHTDETHPEGFDYQSASDLLKRISDTGEGRAYIDHEGNFVYESRFHREP